MNMLTNLFFCRSQELNIDSIVSKRKLTNLSALPQFSVAPAPNCSRDRNEWGKFLTHLRKYDMV
jgi:hypothetical protein